MLSNTTVLIFKILAGIATTVASLILAIRFIRRRSRQHKAVGSALSIGQTDGRRPISPKKLQELYNNALHKIITERLRKESSTEHGERVFLSHYIKNGQFRHWVMHVHGFKYELRQMGVDTSGKKLYKAVISPSSFDHQTYKKSIMANHSPEVGHFFYSLIGWTTYSKEATDREYFQISDGFGTYALLSNNCQDVLQRFADRIVTKKAPDWDWFRADSLNDYRYSEKSKLHDPVIFAAAWSKQLREVKEGLCASERLEAEKLIREIDGFVQLNMNLVMTAISQVAGGGSQADGSGGGGGGGGVGV